MSKPKTGQQAIISGIETPEDLSSTYRPAPRSGPSDNVNAVWTILEANWPNAFKKVDRSDNSRTWADNLDDLDSGQMAEGLKALRRVDDRYMPNAPACRALMREAAPTPAAGPLIPEDLRDDIEKLFDRLRNYVWMRYVARMINERDQAISREMADKCVAIARKKTAEYEDAWRDEKERGQSNWNAVSHGSVNVMLAAWNQICKVPEEKQMKDYGALYPPE